MSFDPKNVQIAVALMVTDDGMAVAWNENWDAFVLPMTKIGDGLPAETAEQAAVRAMAEVLQLPVQVVPGQTAKQMRTLQMSDRDGELKDYRFTVVPTQIHPDFATASIVDRQVIFASADKLQAGEYQPMSPSVKPIIDECVAWSWV